MRYVTLLSPGYSGSTLLSMILCSQPRTIGFGDTYFGPNNSLDNYCNCGQQFHSCTPRLVIQDAVRAGGIGDFGWDRAYPVPIPRSWPFSYRDYWPLRKSISLGAIRKIPTALRQSLFRKFYQENKFMIDGLSGTGKYDYYFDGCKVPNRLELLRTEIPNIKVIHMVRHPGAILYRYQKSGDNRWDKGIAQWARYHRRARSFKELVGDDNYLVVTYELLVQDPGQFLARVGAFLEMPAINTDDPHELRRADVHIIGNRMRKKTDRIVDYSNTWRDHLSAPGQGKAESALSADGWLEDLYVLDK